MRGFVAGPYGAGDICSGLPRIASSPATAGSDFIRGYFQCIPTGCFAGCAGLGFRFPPKEGGLDPSTALRAGYGASTVGDESKLLKTGARALLLFRERSAAERLFFQN